MHETDRHSGMWFARRYDICKGLSLNRPRDKSARTLISDHALMDTLGRARQGSKYGSDGTYVALYHTGCGSAKCLRQCEARGVKIASGRIAEVNEAKRR